MATTISAGNATNGLAFSADNTGALEFKTGSGAGTTALTLSTSQIATFAAGVSGTTGSFSGDMSFNSGYGSSAVAYGCRAWVNFNGTGTIAIRASGNVTSITDGGVGIYTVNLTTAMPDANYSAIVTCSADAAAIRTAQTWSAATMTTTACQLQCAVSSTAAAADAGVMTFAIFR